MPEFAEKTTTVRPLREIPFKLMVESVQDYAIFMLNPQGYIISWNIGAERLKGYSADEAIGRHFSMFYTQPDRDREHPAFELKHAIEHGRYEEEGWRVRKDGTLFWANVVITAIRNEQGELVGFGKVTRDLTERRRKEEAERALLREQAARAEAEALNRAKSEFLQVMSHELRTPLNAILGYIELLEIGVQGSLNGDQLHSLERVRRSTKHLLSLINDVLNLSRLDARDVDYHIRDVAANDLLREVEALVMPQFVKQQVEFAIVPCEEDTLVRCDQEKAQQILLNLLTNAYKFTPPGGTVTLACEVNSDVVGFIVSDTGRGIPEDRLADIFEPFVQIDRHLNTESQQGVGLGLAISRDLARRMGGDLIAKSELDVGSRFMLTLPRAVPVAPQE